MLTRHSTYTIRELPFVVNTSRYFKPFLLRLGKLSTSNIASVTSGINSDIALSDTRYCYIKLGYDFPFSSGKMVSVWFSS